MGEEGGGRRKKGREGRGGREGEGGKGREGRGGREGEGGKGREGRGGREGEGGKGRDERDTGTRSLCFGCTCSEKMGLSTIYMYITSSLSSSQSTTIEVVQLELAEWPSEGYPHPSSMLGLLEALTKTQLTTPTDCITIHSR